MPALRAQLLARQQALQQEVFALLAAAGGGAGGATGPGEFNIDSPEQVRLEYS